MDSFEEESENFESVSYGIKIKSELNVRISNHMRALKHLEGKGYTKKRWIQEAIKERLQIYKNIDIEKIQSDCNLNFSISRYANNEIEKIVGLFKKLKIKTSKTDFFIEAILAKLEKEELAVKDIFQKMIKKSSEPSLTFENNT